MTLQNRLASLTLLIFGIVFLMFINPAQTSTGDETVVSPRLLPNACAVIIVICSGILLIKDLMLNLGRSTQTMPDVDAEAGITRAEFGGFLSVTALLILCVVLFIWTGPIWSSILLILGTQLLAGERNLILLVLMPASLVAGGYVLFYHVLGTSVV